jgi:hypothetical protein
MRAGRATERIQINRHFMHSSSGAAARPDKCVLACMANVGGRTGQKKGASSSWQTQMMPRGCVDGRLNFTPCCRGERDGAKCSIGVQSTHSCDFDMRVLPRSIPRQTGAPRDQALRRESGAGLDACRRRRQVVAPRLGRSGCGADLNVNYPHRVVDFYIAFQVRRCAIAEKESALPILLPCGLSPTCSTATSSTMPTRARSSPAWLLWARRRRSHRPATR